MTYHRVVETHLVNVYDKYRYSNQVTVNGYTFMFHCHFTKGSNLFLFSAAFRDYKALLRPVLFLMERIYSKGGKFFFQELTPI